MSDEVVTKHTRRFLSQRHELIGDRRKGTTSRTGQAGVPQDRPDLEDIALMGHFQIQQQGTLEERIKAVELSRCAAKAGAGSKAPVQVGSEVLEEEAPSPKGILSRL